MEAGDLAEMQDVYFPLTREKKLQNTEYSMERGAFLWKMFCTINIFP